MIHYVTKSIRSSMRLLVDRRANGGVVRRDVRVVETHPDHKVDILSIDNDYISVIPLASAGALTTTITGEVIGTMYQQECDDKNKTINYSPQIDYCKNIVEIFILDKCKILMFIRGASPHMQLRPCNDKEWNALPYVMLTSYEE